MTLKSIIKESINKFLFKENLKKIIRESLNESYFGKLNVKEQPYSAFKHFDQYDGFLQAIRDKNRDENIKKLFGSLNFIRDQDRLFSKIKVVWQENLFGPDKLKAFFIKVDHVSNQQMKGVFEYDIDGTGGWIFIPMENGAKHYWDNPDRYVGENANGTVEDEEDKSLDDDTVAVSKRWSGINNYYLFVEVYLGTNVIYQFMADYGKGTSSNKSGSLEFESILKQMAHKGRYNNMSDTLIYNAAKEFAAQNNYKFDDFGWEDQ